MRPVIVAGCDEARAIIGEVWRTAAGEYGRRGGALDRGPGSGGVGLKVRRSFEGAVFSWLKRGVVLG